MANLSQLGLDAKTLPVSKAKQRGMDALCVSQVFSFSLSMGETEMMAALCQGTFLQSFRISFSLESPKFLVFHCVSWLLRLFL